jgi:hypothetical protein
VNGAGHKTPKTKLVFAPMPRESSPLRRANSFSTIQSSGLFRSTVSSALLSGFLVFLFFDNTFLLKVKLFKPRPSAAYLFSFNVRTPQFILNMAVEKSGFGIIFGGGLSSFLAAAHCHARFPTIEQVKHVPNLVGKRWILCFGALHGPSRT